MTAPSVSAFVSTRPAAFSLMMSPSAHVVTASSSPPAVLSGAVARWLHISIARQAPSSCACRERAPAAVEVPPAFQWVSSRCCQIWCQLPEPEVPRVAGRGCHIQRSPARALPFPAILPLASAGGVTALLPRIGSVAAAAAELRLAPGSASGAPAHEVTFRQGFSRTGSQAYRQRDELASNR